MKNILICISVFAIIFSCSSDDDSVQQQEQQQQQLEQEEEPNFYALEVGNSWVYKSLRYDSTTEVYNETEIIDSVSVVGTEEILGNSYFKVRTKTTGNTFGSSFYNINGVKFDYLREFEGELVNENNEVIFTTTDYSEHIVVEDVWGSIFEKLAEELSTVEVPAGTFECYNKERYARTPEGDPLPSLDNFYYAEGVGVIYDSLSLIALDRPIVIRQLTSYSVQ